MASVTVAKLTHPGFASINRTPAFEMRALAVTYKIVCAREVIGFQIARFNNILQAALCTSTRRWKHLQMSTLGTK
jgi:hypothetical protein